MREWVYNSRCLAQREPVANIELTAVVLTLNEELRLPNCLSNLSTLRRCVVVDSGSTDRTVDVAIEIGCDVYINPWQGFAKQRNWALANTGIDTDWVLFVDADEVYPLHFFEWFAKEVSGHSEIDAVMVPSYLFFRGRRLKFAPGYPIYHPRLGSQSKQIADIYMPEFHTSIISMEVI